MTSPTMYKFLYKHLPIGMKDECDVDSSYRPTYKNKQQILEILDQYESTEENKYIIELFFILIDDNLLDDREIMLAFLNKYGSLIHMCVPDFRLDRECILIAMKSYPEALNLAPIEIQEEFKMIQILMNKICFVGV